MEILMNHEAEPTEVASAWIEYLTKDEKEAGENKSEYESYKINLRKCFREVVMKRDLGYKTG